MRENILFIMLIGILLLGFMSNTLTGQAPRETLLDRSSKTAGAGYDVVGERNYLITRGTRTDVLGGPSRAGYSLLFGNFPFPGKGDLDHDGSITVNDLHILQLIFQRGTDARTPSFPHDGLRWEYNDENYIPASDRTYGIYDPQGDINGDGQVTRVDLILLRNALNPYLGIKTSLISDYKEQVDCVQMGRQTCAVERRGQLGTCKEILKGGSQYGLLAYQWEPCPKGHSCLVRTAGRAECVPRVVSAPRVRELQE